MAKPLVQQEPLLTRRHYYPRPMSASILFEENAMNSALSYYSKSIYK